MRSANLHFGGEEFSRELLTQFSTAQKKRGRPTALDDQRLSALRDSYVQFLEQTWGLVAWKLQKAKTPAELRDSFATLETETKAYYRLEPFTRECAEVIIKSSELRKIRVQLAHIEAKRYDAYGLEQKLREAVDRVSVALRHFESEEQRTILDAENTIRQKKLEDAASHSAALLIQHENLRDTLAEMEAQFAQCELLDFFRSRRYAFTPINVANAMAGLPYMGWRQSFKRCAAIECHCANSPAFETFKLIQAAASHSGPLCTSIRMWLASSRHKGFAMSELKKNWYYLRKAIGSLQDQTYHPKSLPYRITAEYHRNLHHRSAVDLVLEEEERIP